MFINVDERAVKQLFDGVSTKTFWGENMLISLLTVEPGGTVPMHNHPHEQIGIILQGEFNFTLGGETRSLQVGDMYIAPGMVEHGGTGGSEGCVTAEIFSPVREDFQYE